MTDFLGSYRPELAKLDAEGKVGPKLVGRADLLEERWIHGGAAADGEVDAPMEVLATGLQVWAWLQQRQAERLRCKKVSGGRGVE